jgi:dipeptidyl aminopeptidase/acylaminoacyl peptidase
MARCEFGAELFDRARWSQRGLPDGIARDVAEAGGDASGQQAHFDARRSERKTAARGERGISSAAAILAGSDWREVSRGGEEAPLQVLAQRGFVVICLDVPSRRTEKSSFDEAIRDWDAPLEAMQAMADDLSAEGLIDRTRLGILGSSFGAELVDHAISRSLLFAAAAAAGGGSHDPAFLPYAESTSLALYGFPGVWWDEGATLDKWRAFSPMLRAKQISTPLLIQVADRESMMPLPAFKQLQRYEKPVEMWVFPDERHVKWWPRNKLSANERNLAWFEFWLMGRCVTTPGRSEGCERWKLLFQTTMP